MVAVRRGASAAGTVSAAADASSHKVAHGLAALTSSKVLATLMLGSGTLLEFLDGRRVARLTNWVLSSACLTRAECASHRGGREADRAGEGRARTLLGLAINSKRRQVLLVATTESVGRWRWERDHILGWRVGLLRRRSAARTPRAGVALVGRRDMEHWSINLGRRSSEAGSWRRRRVRQTRHTILSLHVAVVLLVARVNDVLVLASHLVEDKVDTRLVGLLDGSGVSKLLAIGVHLRSVWRVGVLLPTAHVHVAELLGRQSKELLLELLLPLGEVELGSQKLSRNVGVHLAVIELELGRGQDLVVEVGLLLLLLVLVDTAEARADGSLGTTLVGSVELPGVVGVVGTNVVLALRVGSRSRGLRRRGSLGRSAEAGQEVGAAGARSRNRVLGDGGNLGRRGDAETLKLSALAARGKARGGTAKATLGLEVVVGHLSKTASVHAHCGGLRRVANKE